MKVYSKLTRNSCSTCLDDSAASALSSTGSSRPRCARAFILSSEWRASCQFLLVILFNDLLKWVTVKIYDYHPVIPCPDAEAPKQSLGDCAICMEPIMMHPDSTVNANKGTSSQILSSTTVGLRRIYALAPCHHIFVSYLPIIWTARLNHLLAYTMFGPMARYQGKITLFH